jgi:hypothetical protein
MIRIEPPEEHTHSTSDKTIRWLKRHCCTALITHDSEWKSPPPANPPCCRWDEKVDPRSLIALSYRDPTHSTGAITMDKEIDP